MLDASVQWRIDHGTIDLREPGYRGTAEAILDAGLATEVRRLISAGKEADVYLCAYNGAPLAVKVYRLYRTSHRGGRPIKVDTMSWLAAQEFEMMRQAWKGGAPVPAPARRIENMLSLRYLGTEDGPAPRLHDFELADPSVFLDSVVAGVRALARAGVVHADLSAFNILVYDNSRTGRSAWMRLTQTRDALARGGHALETYFRRYRVAFDTEGFVDAIASSLERFKTRR